MTVLPFLNLNNFYTSLQRIFQLSYSSHLKYNLPFNLTSIQKLEGKKLDQET